MKNLALIPVFLLALSLVGCNPGGETGDPNVGANTAPRETSEGKRPGTPGGPAAITPRSSHDATGGGRPGATTG